MCGISGILNYQGFDLQALKQSLFHRGPDEQSIFTDDNLALIHTRLAIQDVLHGKQPFHYQQFTIIFNGEIYNHIELRDYLKDFAFQTRSDVETLLFLYIKYDLHMFSMLDGMFAFCIYDRQKNILLLARDRAGKKPLYYSHENNSFIFASELNAIKSIKNLTINEDAINCYLRVGFISKSHTPYKNVHEVEASSYVIVDVNTQKLKFKKYYSLLDSYYRQAIPLSLQDTLCLVDNNLKKSIADRLLSSDHEVGAFLSGGIDSNLIVSMASQICPKLQTFTVKFDDLYDESPLARLTAEKYQTNHTELEISLTLDKDIENILHLYGEPFMDSSAIPSYYLAKEAKKNVKVVLNGDGADELFGGYRRYVPIANNMMRYFKFASAFKGLLPKPNYKQSVYNYLYRLIAIANKQNLDFYLSTTTDIFEDIYVFINNPILMELNDFITTIMNDKKLTSLSKILYLDFNLLLFSDLLVKMDIATMASSLEARSPFLSKYMLDIIPSLPDKYKINKFGTKFILRELAKRYLPLDLIHQPKRGFEVPLRQWVEVDLKTKIHDSLAPGCYSEKYIDRHFLFKILQNKLAMPAEKRAKILWGLFCLEAWYLNQ